MVSPMRTASAPMRSAISISRLLFTPLSEMNTLSSGTQALSLPAFPMSTVKSPRFLLLTPMMRAPQRTAMRISSSSCASTTAESLSLLQRASHSRISFSVRIEQMSRTASAPASFAS